MTYAGELSAARCAWIDSADRFFLATADPRGRPDCPYKGGRPGFVRALSEGEIARPDQDGNGQFRSLGNLRVHPWAGPLFVDWTRPARLRVNGSARVLEDDPLLAAWEGAQLFVRVDVEQVFPNCPRYVHRMERVATSPYAPRPGCEPPRPAWKDDAAFADALQRRGRPR